MKFLDVKTDYAFKKVFGSDRSKDVLLSFLNALLRFGTRGLIRDLTIVDPYQIPLLKGMKDTYVDVKAVLEDGSGVIIEMQVLNFEGFEKRVLYNATKAYSSQLTIGDDYTLLNPIVALTITDFIMFPEFKKTTSFFRLWEKDELVEYGGDVELVFIELPKFGKTEGELATIADKWVYFVKNAGSLKYVPETLASEPEINKAFDIANEAGLTEEEREAQHRRKDFIYINRKSIETAEIKGLEKGLEKGRAEGHAALLSLMLTAKFGSISEIYQHRIAEADAETLLAWGKRLLTAMSIDQVFDRAEG